MITIFGGVAHIILFKLIDKLIYILIILFSRNPNLQKGNEIVRYTFKTLYDELERKSHFKDF